MSWLTRILNVFRNEQLYNELDEEIRFHIDERTDDLVEQGYSPEAARREAMKRFGNATKEREEARDANIAGWVDGAVGDLRFGVRQLRLNPGFTVIAVVSLALGIGANSAIFQLINALALRPLPVPQAEELVAIDVDEDFFIAGFYDGRNQSFTYAQWQEIEERQRAFSGLLAFGTTQFNLSEGGEARYVDGLYLSPNYFDVLEIEPKLGVYGQAEDPLDCSRAGAILDHAFWQREFAGDPKILDRQIRLSGQVFNILAVTPPDFHGLEPAFRFDVAVPLCAEGLMASDGKGRAANKAAWWLTLIGRLKPGWNVERASAHLAEISPAVFRQTLPDIYRPESAESYLQNELQVVGAASGVSEMRADFQSPLWILLASTGLVLLLACANLANLLLARASVREREIALRQAIGASRGRLISQLLAESLLLASLGGVLGAAVATILSRGMVHFLDDTGEALYLPLGVDWNVVIFTAGLALLTCLLFGWAPAWRASQSAPADALRGGRGSASESGSLGLRRVLVVAQIGLSLVLLVGALLFGQSLNNILSSESGMESEGLIVAIVDGSDPAMDEGRRSLIFDELGQGIEAIPDIASVSTLRIIPFTGSGWNHQIYAGESSGSENRTAWFNRVGEGYFETTGISLLAGRDFNSGDRPSEAKVAIINEEMARHLFGSENPVGRTFRHTGEAGKADPVYQIVGVAANSKHYELQEEPRAMAFLPASQEAEVPEETIYIARVRGSEEAARQGIKAAMAGLDPALQVQFGVLDEQIQSTVLRERLMANLSAGFGILASLLAALGLYGVMSYLVTCRRREIGLRMALGAQRGSIFRLICQEAGLLLGLGLTVGGAATLGLSRFAESLLYGLKAHDGMTLVAGGALLAVVASIAVLMPLRRALGLEPSLVLRDD